MLSHGDNVTKVARQPPPPATADTLTPTTHAPAWRCPVPRPGKKTSPEAIGRVERQNKALEMRLAGFSQQQIADNLKVSKTTAHRYLMDALDAIPKENAVSVLRMELARLDTAQLALRSKVLKGDEKAINSTVRLMERRARYLNLDGALGDEKDNGEGLIAALAATVDKMYRMQNGEPDEAGAEPDE